MNLPLFTTQLNSLLQTPSDDHLHDVCDLLRIHTAASIRVEARGGRVVLEMFGDGEDPLFKKTLNFEFARKYKLILKRGRDFTRDEAVAAEVAVCMCTILMRSREGAVSADKKRRVKAVRAVINSLSFSELEAATQAVKELAEKGEGNEGLLIAGHIADRLGFTRSVVTGALRKLEGAGLIETRSLGMKGTYIRVMDALLTEELAKL